MADTIDYAAPAPSPELKKLDFLIGRWKVEGSFKESQFGPGGLVDGEHTWKWFNEYFLEHSWKQELGSGIEYIGWDEPNKRFHTHYFDSNGPYDEEGSTYEGEFRGKVLVYCGPARLTYTPSADGKTIRFTSELPKNQRSQGLDAPDADWQEWLEATFTKIES